MALGNARVNYRANGASVTYLEDMHYYPFGMLLEGLGATASPGNKYRYNGKEMNDDLGLNWYDYGARWYDAAVGRWWSVDPLAAKTADQSSYNYVLNNPLILIDPTGMSAVGADGLTAEQWIEASRPGADPGLEDAYRKENREKAQREQGEQSESAPKNSVDNANPDQSENCCPDWMNKYLPIWSSGRDAYIDWENGDYGWAIFNGVMAVSDVFLVKSVFVAGGKIILKGGLKTSGSHTWGATKSHWQRRGIDELTSGSKHHWGISRDFMKKHPGLEPFGNQFPNIIRYKNQSDHFRYGHGLSFRGVSGVGLLGRFWYGTPTWFKTTTFYGVDKIENKFRRN